MGRRGRLVATVAAGVLAGLAGPATAASAATGFDDGRATHAVTYAVDVHEGPYAEDFREGPYAVDFREGGVSEGSGASPSTAASMSATTSDTNGKDPDAPDDSLAETGAGVLPWIAAAGAGALGVGAVVFATIRRRSE